MAYFLEDFRVGESIPSE